MSRQAHLTQLYELLHELEMRHGRRVLAQCNGHVPWPERGVYFFFEPGEMRSGLNRKRVVRVGTHAVSRGSGSTLWNRLSQHRGTATRPGGNHRGSVFRQLVGAALAVRNPALACPTWGIGSIANKAVRLHERPLEIAVSEYMGRLEVLWLGVDDEPGPNSVRSYIERNVIALLSNFEKPAIDAPSENWLGRECPKEKVRRSGLWNSNHVDEDYEPAFLSLLERLIIYTGSDSTITRCPARGEA